MCLWPCHGEGLRSSRSPVPPCPGGSSLAVGGVGVGVGQAGGLGAGLHGLDPLLQAAAGEHHVAGAEALLSRLPQVLLAVPDAVAEVHQEPCGGTAAPEPCRDAAGGPASGTSSGSGGGCEAA